MLYSHTFDADTHGHTPPLSSCGTCKPTDEYPYCTVGPCSWGDKVSVLATNGVTSLVASCWLPPKNYGATWLVSGRGKYKYKYKYKCVCVCFILSWLIYFCGRVPAPNGSILCALGTSYPPKVPLYEQRWTTIAPARITQLSPNIYHLLSHPLGLAWVTNGTPSTAINGQATSSPPTQGSLV